MNKSKSGRDSQQLFQQAQALHQSGRLDEASLLYAKLLRAHPGQPALLNCAGLLALQQNRLEDAARLLGQSLRADPDQPGTLSNRAVALRKLGRLDEALASYDQALARKSGYVEAHNNRGNVLKDLKRLDEALAAFDRALALDPAYAEAYYNKGLTLQELKRVDEAVVCYNRAMELKPVQDFLAGNLLHAKMKLCDWHGFQPLLKDLIERVQNGEKAAQPFHLLALVDSPALQAAAADLVVRQNFPAAAPAAPVAGAAHRDRIRIAYYSADYHNHATSYLIAGLIEAHDRNRFETIGFSYGPDRQDEMRQRMAAAFDRFIDVRSRSDRDVAQLSRELGIDIAIDLKGHTQDARLGIFAARAAPLQVSYLGFPGSARTPFMDYLLADPLVVPEHSRGYFTEKIVCLPSSFFVTDARRAIADRIFTREQLGLPPSGFVFCCFNNSYKILPEVFTVWMSMLRRVEGSVLWLLEDNPTMAGNLRREAEGRGIAANRLVFAERLPSAEHLARHRAADLFVDTLPCNAHTTASDALWAGLPVLTCLGEAFAGRVAASLLTAIGMPELIAANLRDYEELAVAIAMRPELHAGLRQKLMRNRLTTPLFDTTRFARHIEAAYQAMVERHRAGLPPGHLAIDG